MAEKQKALDYFNQALALIRAAGSRSGEAGVLNNMGWIYYDLGDRQRALDLFEDAIEIWQQIQNRSGEAATFNGIGRIYLDWGDHQKALEYFNQTFLIAKEIDDGNLQASSLNNMGIVNFNLGKWEEALDYYHQALPLRSLVGDPLGESYTQNCLGKTYSKLDDTNQSLEHFNRALLLSQQIGDRRMEAISYFNIAQVEFKLGKLNESKDHIETSLEVIENLRTKIDSQELRASYFGFINDYYKFYIQLIMNMHQQQPMHGYDIAALNTSERARARSLIENLAMAYSEIRQGVDFELIEKEKKLQRQLNAKEQYRAQLIKEKGSVEQIESIEKEIRNLLLQYDENVTQIRKTSPHYASLIHPDPVSIQDIQQQVLDENTTIIEYALGEEQSFLWIVTPNEIFSFELPEREIIETAAKHVYELLTTRNQRLTDETIAEKRKRITKADSELADAMRQLSDMILKPELKQLPAKRLVVVSEGALQYIPFGALPILDSKDGASQKLPIPLISKYEVVSLPSASIIPILRQNIDSRTRTVQLLAVLADPVFSADDPRVSRSKLLAVNEQKAVEKAEQNMDITDQIFTRSLQESGLSSTRSGISRLPFSRQEANAILALAPKERCLSAFDFQASYETATNPDLGNYRMIHFATHGLLNSQNPQLSGIVLSLVNPQGEPQQGFMRLFDIYNLDLSAELVVLSACQTALGKDIRGEGLIGLTRGFMYAGASRVVASLWKVDDEATAELMKRFYQYMLGDEQLPASVALRKAQISIRNEKRWQSPYFWAGFILQGDWK